MTTFVTRTRTHHSQRFPLAKCLMSAATLVALMIPRAATAAAPGPLCGTSCEGIRQDLTSYCARMGATVSSFSCGVTPTAPIQGGGGGQCSNGESWGGSIYPTCPVCTTVCPLAGGTGDCAAQCSGPRVYEAVVTPKYLIYSLTYQPPGSKGCASPSAVTYSNDSAFGTSVSTNKTFKAGTEVTVSAKTEAAFGIFGGGASASSTFGYSRSVSDRTVMNIQKASSSTLKISGHCVDGVDHNQDRIWLWLNPKLKMRFTEKAAAWTFDFGAMAEVQYLHVGWLKNPALIPPGVRDRLVAYGITSSDYPEILKANPFVGTSVDGPPDPNRFASLNTSIPYEPPYASGDPTPIYTYSFAYNTTSMSERTISRDTSVKASFTGSASAGAVVAKISTSLMSSGSLTWTSTNMKSNSTSATERAEMTIGGPAFGYTGPTSIGVYYDKIYRTFAFHPITWLPSLSGRISDASGEPVAGQEVIVKADGQTYRSFTDRQGQYRVFGDIVGPAEVSASGVQRLVQPSARAWPVELTVPRSLR